MTNVRLLQYQKVVVGEPASIGTLLELGNCAFDILRYLVNQKPPASSKAPAKDTQSQIALARQLLESVLLYATSQLVMSLVKDDDEVSGDMDLDDHAPEGGGQRVDGIVSKDRRRKRQSLTLEDRLRRGMTGELVADLQGLIARANPVVIKSTEVLGADVVDLTSILGRFLDDRISVFSQS